MTQTAIIQFIFLAHLVHLCLLVSIPDWTGIYNVDDSCDQVDCCCVAEVATITMYSNTQLLVIANVAGAPCQQQLNGSVTVSVLVPIPQDKNGFQTTLNFLGTENRFTLSDDSQYLANANLESPKCSGMARKVVPNWLGTFKIDDSCDQNECCCLFEQATVTKMNDIQFLVSAHVAGKPCNSQLNGSTTVKIPVSIPQDKNGFQLTVDFLGSNNRFTLTYDNQYIAHANLQNPKCSAAGRRVEDSKNKASLTSSASVFILISTLFFRMIYV